MRAPVTVLSGAITVSRSAGNWVGPSKAVRVDTSTSSVTRAATVNESPKEAANRGCPSVQGVPSTVTSKPGAEKSMRSAGSPSTA